MTDFAWMDDDQLAAATVEARRVAHGCPVYTGDKVYEAVRSGARAFAASERWMTLRREQMRRDAEVAGPLHPTRNPEAQEDRG